MKPVTFLRGIYANGGAGYFDAFGHHPYSFPCSPLQNAEWNAFTQTQYLHNIMAQNGDGGKKIWGTESGAPTGDNVASGCTSGPNVSVSEGTQAQYVADYFKGWTQDFGKFTGPLIWFQIRDSGTNKGDWEQNLGLLRRDFSPEAGVPEVPAAPERLTPSADAVGPGRDQLPARPMRSTTSFPSSRA